MRGGHAGEEIGGAGPAGDQADAGEIRDAGEAVGHEGGGLLVAHVDVLHAPVVVERVEHVEKGRAHDPEDVADALRLEQPTTARPPVISAMGSSLVHDEAAVHAERLAGHVARLARGEEADHVGHVLGAFHRAPAAPAPRAGA